MDEKSNWDWNICRPSTRPRLWAFGNLRLLVKLRLEIPSSADRVGLNNILQDPNKPNQSTVLSVFCWSLTTPKSHCDALDSALDSKMQDEFFRIYYRFPLRNEAHIKLYLGIEINLRTCTLSKFSLQNRKATSIACWGQNLVCANNFSVLGKGFGGCCSIFTGCQSSFSSLRVQTIDSQFLPVLLSFFI